MKIKLRKPAAFILFVGVFALISSAVWPNIYFLTLAALAIWLTGVMYSVFKVSKRFSLLSFNTGFFIFILGGYSIDLFTNFNTDYLRNSNVLVTDEAINHLGICMVICMLIVNFTYMLLDTIRPVASEEKYEAPDILPNNTMRLVLMLLIIIGFTCKLLLSIEDFAIVRATSFRIHASTLSHYPYYVTALSSLFLVSTFAFWGLMPGKRETIFTFILLGIPEIFQLLSGERGEPISVVLTILFYVMHRNRLGNYDFTIKKSAVIVSLIVLPFVIYSLQFIAYARNHMTYDKSLGVGITEFFATQGGSVKIISNAFVMRDRIDAAAGHDFFLGEIREYLKSNIFARYLAGTSVRTRTVEDALNGDNFLRCYGYLYSPGTYKAGVGGGSTYIAEVYHDGGYVFLVLFNIFIAFVIRSIDNTKIGNIIHFTISMGIFKYIATLPREQALQWFTGTFALQNLLFYFFLYVFYVRPNMRISENRDTHNKIRIGKQR
ncbi:MAG: O-antigen polysaccharide polymerase Wzy family protein [Abditibacteriota bacterium]|nr:O-antigen polysaccharide polymerase Wzy family protein [Abditibacteriota bacterium]